MPDQANDPWSKYAVAKPDATPADKWAKFAQSPSVPTSTVEPMNTVNASLAKATGIGPHTVKQALSSPETTKDSMNPLMQMASPVAAATALPMASRAGAKLAGVAKAMEDVPVALPKTKAMANAAVEVISHGGKPSKLVSDFLGTVGEGEHLSWKDARDFISNASSRSRLAELFEGQTGHARYAIGQFVGQLGEEIKATAQQAGQGEDYGTALKEYRNAMRIARALKASAVVGGAYALKKMSTAGANSAVKTMWSALE